MRAALIPILFGGFNPRLLFAGGVVGGWWEPSDIATLYQDSPGTVPVAADGDPVAIIRDKSGNANHLIVPSDTARVTFHKSGGMHWVESDGVADGTPQFMSATFTLAQPWYRFSAMQEVSWQSGRLLTGAINLNAGMLQQTNAGASPQLRMFAGSGTGNNTDLAIGANGVISEFYNGAASSLTINNGVPVVGDAGTSAPGGVVLFAQQNGTSPTAARCYGQIVVQGNLSANTIGKIRRYLAQKAGVGL